jgi:hypothetical protein
MEEMGRACSTKGGIRGMHIAFSWESQMGKEPLGRRRHRWVDNIKMDLRDRMGWYGLN